MKHKLGTYLYWALAVAPFAASAALYSRLPKQVAIHFDAEGNANGFASRAFAAFGLPALFFGLLVFVNAMLYLDPKWKNINHSPQMKQTCRWGTLLVLDGTNSCILGKAVGFSFNISILITLLTGLLFIVIGNYLPKCKYNYSMGIRLPWTLASEENWRKTHRFAGAFWIFGGILTALSAFFRWPWIIFVNLVLLTVIPAVYSFLLYWKNDRTEK